MFKIKAMKKSILNVLFASMLLIACKKEENKIQEPMADPPVESVNETPQNTAEDITILTAPNFQYAEADQFAKEYVEFIKDYRIAADNNDGTAMDELGKKLNDYQKRGVELAKRVPQQEAVAFQDFLNELERRIR